jgi:hypothetical protein
MKKRQRTYDCCGKVSFTFSKAPRCTTCASVDLYADSRNRIKKALEDLGHTEVELGGFHTTKFAVSFFHPVCGTQQTWQASNITKVLKRDPNTAPCSKCGGVRRMKKALDAYVEKYGMSEERAAEWEGYRQTVRRLSDQNYRLHKDIINPLNLNRGVHTHHLDHRTPIIEGFLQGFEPTFVARVENLQMLPATKNLSKGRSAE